MDTKTMKYSTNNIKIYEKYEKYKRIYKLWKKKYRKIVKKKSLIVL